MSQNSKSVLHRLLSRLVRPYVMELRQGQIGLQDAIDRLHGDLGRVHRELEEVHGRSKAIEVDARRSAEIARHSFDREVENRQLLHALRRTEEYELAFSEDEPLVSFLIPTYTSYETLRDVALPSILGQSYSNLEVIVVGDAAPPETAAAIEAIGDPRVRYFNRTYRGPYPEDRSRRWYVIGTPPYNEALAQARGRWIAGLGDDDAVRPDHTERLLAAAREHRYEHCYGKQLVNFVEGEPMTLGKFPPKLGEWGLQAAIFHSGLRFIESELSDAIYQEPNDWSMCRRMIRIGVRTGMIDEVVVDKFETRRSSSEAWKEGSVPQVD
ncbi:MAG TPA: glycosyltransferase family 2 protein [Solirubrobacterales bacterium]|nr:glycosyltransferase family 2 protein [Solirubrobacterales bacterium]